MKRPVTLVVFLALAFAPAVIGTHWGPDAWYTALAKPSWNPPGWVFAPVWTVLYALIGVSGWLVWREMRARPEVRSDARAALVIYAVQLVLNGAWTWLFFGLHRPGAALVEIMVLWAAILTTMVAFGRVRPLAGWLLVPYAAWVTFAAVLNSALWRMNGGGR